MRYRANLVDLASFCGLAAIAVAWGLADIPGLEAEAAAHTTSLIAGAIALLLGLPMLGSSLAVNARVRATCAAPAGGWTVSPQDIAALREWQQRRGTGHEWRPTRSERTRGTRVFWAGEHLVVGGHYWRVAPGQYCRSSRSGDSRRRPAWCCTTPQARAHNMSSVPRFVRTER